MKKRFVTVAALMAVTGCLLAGCGNSNTGTPSGDGTPTVTETPQPTEGIPVVDNGASNSITEEGVTITVTTDKSSYKAGEKIYFKFTIENGRALYVLTAAEVSYSITAGLVNAGTEKLPSEIPAIAYGESYEMGGVLIGNETTFPVTEEIVEGEAPEPIGPQKTTGADVSVIKTGNKIVLRPYVEFMYGGEQVMVRATMSISLGMEKQKFSLKEYEGAKRTTCHDPSIFRDVDGTYYIFGTHMALSSSTNLKDWTNLDTTFRNSFDAETKAAIRQWNLDEAAGQWFDYLWAPDVIYNEAMGKYTMYLSANGDIWKSNIVLLTADAPMGPWSYAGSVVYGGFKEENWTETDVPKALGVTELPERYIKYGIRNGDWGDEYPNCIDPTVFYDDEGNLWMAYGSWSGGIFILALDEETGLRDYNVTYETNEHSDAYFGTKIAGGKYVSGEGAYIEKIGDYYWLFVSYGNLEAKGGYNVRVFRSTRPDGGYVDALGNDAYYDKYVFNYNLTNKGVRLFGGYQWRSFSLGEVAQGHNSAFVDADGRAHIVYHTRTNDGSEGHSVRVHQLFLNKEGWLVAAPYQTTKETLDPSVCTVDNVAGSYEVILHKSDIGYTKLEVMTPERVYLNADGTVTGVYEGTWSVEEGTSYITLKLGEETYSGVVLKQQVENLLTETIVFSALGQNSQLMLWGSKSLEK